MLTQTKHTVLVRGGGEKHDLFAQLSDIGRTKSRPTFKLTLVNADRQELQQICDAVINGIIAEDGTGEHWNIMGHIINPPEWAVGFRSFNGQYNSETREGVLHKA